MVTYKNPPGAPQPVSPIYSTVAVIPAGRRVLALSGQVGMDLGGAIAETVEAQFRQALANILAIVASEGGSGASVARLTCYFTERPKDFGQIGQAMSEAFPDGAPAMTLLYIAGLYAPNVKVEIEALAAVG